MDPQLLKAMLTFAVVATTLAMQMNVLIDIRRTLDLTERRANLSSLRVSARGAWARELVRTVNYLLLVGMLLSGLSVSADIEQQLPVLLQSWGRLLIIVTFSMVGLAELRARQKALKTSKKRVLKKALQKRIGEHRK